MPIQPMSFFNVVYTAIRFMDNKGFKMQDQKNRSKEIVGYIIDGLESGVLNLDDLEAIFESIEMSAQINSVNSEEMESEDKFIRREAEHKLIEIQKACHLLTKALTEGI